MCRRRGDGLDVWTDGLVVGWRGGAQEFTVPTRWQAARANAECKNNDKRQQFEANAVSVMEASSFLQAG